jgi:cysteine desulfurase
VVNYHLQKGTDKPHIITTKLEHQSVYNTVRELERRGVVTATYISPDRNGLISAENILSAIKPSTVLISVIFVSNEIGSILPVREIGHALKTGHHPSRPVFHIDAVQAAKFFNLNVEKLDCDLLTLSAHKLYGPKGVGALFVKTGLKMANLSIGGSQEYGKRPGTQNTVGIIGFAKALELLGPLEEKEALSQKISILRDQLIDNVLAIKDVELNGPRTLNRVADNASFTIYNVDQDALLTALDLEDLSASTGSACVSGSSEPSYVIEALGKLAGTQAATLRLTLGSNTTAAEISRASKIITKVINQLRK